MFTTQDLEGVVSLHLILFEALDEAFLIVFFSSETVFLSCWSELKLNKFGSITTPATEITAMDIRISTRVKPLLLVVSSKQSVVPNEGIT